MIKRCGGDVGWVETEWSGRPYDLTRGDLRDREREFIPEQRDEEPRAEVRASIGAKKRRNGRRAKGCRKVES